MPATLTRYVPCVDVWLQYGYQGDYVADIITDGNRPLLSAPTDMRYDKGLKSPNAGSTAYSPASPRDYRLDVLRGLAICLVMLWHTQPLAHFWQLPVHLPTWLFNYQVSLTAVPVLFTVSLMLLMQRTSRGLAYLWRRLQRLLIVLAVCFALQVLVYVVALQRWPALGWHEIWLGGPALPTVGDSVFYFLVNLLLLTALAWPYALLPARWRTIIGLAVLVVSAVSFEALTFSNWSLPYYSPLNFLVYIPLADFVLRYGTGLSRWFWVTVAGFAVLVCQDMLLRSPWGLYLHNEYPQVYARPSIVLGALCLVVAFQRFSIPRVKSLELAGKYSLGLYVVHKWVWYPLALLAAGVSVSPHVEYFVPVAVAALTIGLSCLLVALLGRTPARFIVTSESRGDPRPARRPGEVGGPTTLD